MRFRTILFTTTALTLAFPAYVNAVSLPKFEKKDVVIPEINKEEEVFIEADEMDYNAETQVVTATGNVEILKGENVLFADNISYDKTTDTVTATGNVSAVGGEGNAVFTDQLVLKGDLNDGVIRYFRARLSDGSLLAAAEARRVDGNKMTMRKAVYSPCPICEVKNPDGSGKPPQWQIKANSVVLDQAAHEVTYEDAKFELYGIPIMYTPYFSHPTPDAPSKSGFLMPQLRTDSNLGGALTTPYYFSIAPNIDATAEPVITTKEGVVYAGQYRHLLPFGQYELYGSYTRPQTEYQINNADGDTREWRGHLKGVGRFDLTTNWKTGFDGEIASDDTYLKRYSYAKQDLPSSKAYSRDLLTSKAYVERIEDRDYTSVQTVYFQGLLEQDNKRTTPFALPYIQNHIESSKGIIPGFANSTIWGDVSGFALQRDEGEENQRISGTAGLTVPFLLPGGQLLELTGSLRGDKYYLQDSPGGDNQVSRVIPEASATLRYPLINQISSSGHILIEPIAKLVLSPNEDYNEDIPNEDSQDVEFSDLNVFDNNRFRGIDRVESGARLYYGLRGGYYEKDYNVSYIFGQDYRLGKSPTAIPANSGIEDDLSDFVGRVSANYGDVLGISYKFRFDKDSFRGRRNEIDTTLNLDPVKLSLSYFKLDYDFTDPTKKREEINGLAQVGVSEDWSVLFGGERNLAEEQNIDARVGLLYEGDCTNVMTTLQKSFLSDRDAHSGVSVTLQLGLKNLGNL